MPTGRTRACRWSISRAPCAAASICSGCSRSDRSDIGSPRRPPLLAPLPVGRAPRIGAGDGVLSASVAAAVAFGRTAALDSVAVLRAGEAVLASGDLAVVVPALVVAAAGRVEAVAGRIARERAGVVALGLAGLPSQVVAVADFVPFLHAVAADGDGHLVPIDGHALGPRAGDDRDLPGDAVGGTRSEPRGHQSILVAGRVLMASDVPRAPAG